MILVELLNGFGVQTGGTKIPAVPVASDQVIAAGRLSAS